MPPVPTKPNLKHKSSRRDLQESGFDGSHAREIEQKRNSGQISCAECRRLKIKCDKQIPCQSCQRRGCAALCPNGSLSTGQGTRFVLAATENLHHRMEKMNARIRQLESALTELQGQHSTEPHPLLRPDLLGAFQHDNDAGLPSVDDSTIVNHPPGLLEALGTLSISDGGTSRFFGPTGGSHCLLMVDSMPSQGIADADSLSDSARDSRSPEEVENFVPDLPCKPAPSTPNIEQLVSCLPTGEEARHLTDVYLEQANWLFQSVSKDQMLLELLPAYYVNGASDVTQAENNPHRLGLLLLVFAIGALLDPKQKPCNAQAERYYQCARAAICLQSVLEKPSLETIQALHLLSFYNAVSGNELVGKETSMETSWSLVTLAAHLAHTLGLHRDGLRWGLSDKIATRQRVVFWDVFVADVWNCLEAGRPPTFSLPYIDCQFPGGGSPHDKVHIGSDKQSFYGSWAFRFASDCVADVAARTLTSDPPSYSTILELDRKVRSFPVTEAVEEFVAASSGGVSANATDKGMDVMESMGRFVMSNSREVILLYIHRGYFAQAIIQSPTNPLDGPYTPSFLAAYRASLTILHTVKVQYELHPKLTARIWAIWTYAFSAAVVFGTIVTRGPRSPMASSAMKELHDACLLFSRASSQNRRALKAFPIIKKLMEKAQSALFHAQGDIPHELGQQWHVAENDDDDELAIFAGRMKIVSMKGQATDGVSERPLNTLESMKRSSSQESDRQEKQDQVQHAVLQSYGREQFASSWPQQSGSATGLLHPQGLPTWVMQPPPVPLQIHPTPVPPQVPAYDGPGPQLSTRALLPELSDPYPMADISAVGSQAHSRGHHPHQHCYGQQAHPLTPFSSSNYDDPCSHDGVLHRSSPQAHASMSTHSHVQLHPCQPVDPLPHLHQAQPDNLHPHGPQAMLPALPELAQLGLIPQESGLDQQWTSFMHESAFFSVYDHEG
ncbi:fungal-specific transcription factor domain-containing protein [Pisolithus marmoratus]|nr:fungal-specific transcription factor domain-containing protein [Pisolithus marmoratus]